MKRVIQKGHLGRSLRRVLQTRPCNNVFKIFFEESPGAESLTTVAEKSHEERSLRTVLRKKSSRRVLKLGHSNKILKKSPKARSF